MQTEMLHGDVIMEMSTYDNLDHELAPMPALSDAEMPGYVPALQRWLAEEDGQAGSADANQERADPRRQRLREITTLA